MTLKEFLSLKDPAKVSDKEFLLFHLRLHQWYGKKDIDEQEKKDIIRAHTIARFEFVRRSLRHKCVSPLDAEIDPKIFDEEFSSYYTSFVEAVPSLIPETGECKASIKEKLVKHHTSIHSLWNLVSLCDEFHPSEDFVNAHQALVDFLIENCKWKHPKWDGLDKPKLPMSKVFFYSENTNNTPSVFTLFEFLEHVPEKIEVVPGFVKLELNEKKIEIGRNFGTKLVQVCYFRILRYLKPRDWNFELVDSIESPQLVYDLFLRRMTPFQTIHLSLAPENFAKEITLVSPYLYLVGGLASRGYTSGDIDLLLRSGIKPDDYIKELIFNALGLENVSFVEDKGLAPYTSYTGLMDLVLKRSTEF